MNVIIVEDEKIAAAHLQDLLSEVVPDVKVVGVFEGWKATAKWLSANEPPDLIFLDVQVSDGLSLSLFDCITVNTPVVFTTAYPDYALEAYQFNTIDYMNKPFRKSDIERIFKKYDLVSGYFQQLKTTKSTIKQIKNRILLKEGNKFITLKTDEIVLFFFENRIIYAVDKNNKKYVTNYTSLSELIAVLDPDSFFHANRQIIVHIQFIESVKAAEHGKLTVTMVTKFMPVIISADQASTFKKWLNQE